MLSFFQSKNENGVRVYAVRHRENFSADESTALKWLFGGAEPVTEDQLQGYYVGARAEMITPWSTNATEITLSMGVGARAGIDRIEFFDAVEEDTPYDRMLLRKYRGLTSELFGGAGTPEKVIEVKDLRSYNQEEGLALSDEEIEYLEGVAREIGRPLTDAELFGFSQVNSEHCRHKIFGGTFVIDGEEKEESLFAMIKATSAANPNKLVSAYKDNVAFNEGPRTEFFSPKRADTSDYFYTHEEETVISLKAETHNFPTTVEPFNGAATGSGGEIRDRLAGGRASLPLAGTAVYMTPYPRLEGTRTISARPWLYQTPQELLTKASNGASDFGNKFGQPLICGSVLTFEHEENNRTWGYDKVIMLAGGVGYAKKDNATKGKAQAGDKVVVMGGDNYRIGMGGGAVSSVNTGQYQDAIELNAIQRSNPEMQKRVSNVIRAMAESDHNPIVSIHDHGAGGHLNCLSELIEETGGKFELDKLPIGDPTLSDKEIISNESQERMGLLLRHEDIDQIKAVAERENAPFYVVGEATGDMELTFEGKDGRKPFDLKLSHLFGSAPKTVMTDESKEQHFSTPSDDDMKSKSLSEHLSAVLRLESVGSKDWLTNKVDRSVTGRVARQQTQGILQLPLSDLGAMALDFRGKSGIATSIGHAPQVALADEQAGSRIAIAEALTNLVGAPLSEGLTSVSLSANWMWPCRNAGEDARLYAAVEACSEFAISLGVNIPTGKDSLSMTQKYPDGKRVLSPGTLIISAGAEVSEIRKIVGPVLNNKCSESSLIYVDFSYAERALGGSALYQTMDKIGDNTPDITDAGYFADAFDAVQQLIKNEKVLAIHDISAGGLITTLLEMTFANTEGGIRLTDEILQQGDLLSVLFAENPGVVLQVEDAKTVMKLLEKDGVASCIVGELIPERTIIAGTEIIDIDEMRDAWYAPSRLMEPFQTKANQAIERSKNIFAQPLLFDFKKSFTGLLDSFGKSYNRPTRSGIKAAVIRDKGTNGEREMAYTLYLSGFDVKDVHMTDLTSGRETLDDVQMIVFCGGFSHSDVLGSAKGWAAGFKYNENARQALERFYGRQDTLSLGICNGCQLMAELGLLYPEHQDKYTLAHNKSGRFESGFVTLEIPENDSVMLRSLAGTKVGCWIAHGEGRFNLPYGIDKYNIAVRYAYGEDYPANPNGSPDGIAGMVSSDGRHLAMMPHPERSIFPWQCGTFPYPNMDVTPWFEAFVNAFNWCREHK